MHIQWPKRRRSKETFRRSYILSIWQIYKIRYLIFRINKKIIDICISKKIKIIELEERRIINTKKIKDIMYSNASRFSDVRQIDKIIEEFIDMELVNIFLLNNTQKWIYTYNLR